MSPAIATSSGAAGAPAAAPGGKYGVFTMKSIKELVSADSSRILIVFHNKVYDLSKWAKFHPGGDLAVRHMNGRDATDAIIAYHPDWVIDKKIPHFCVGELAPNERTVSSKISLSYRAMDQKIRNLGLYQTNYSFYIRELCKFAAIWVAAVYLVLAFPNFYGVLASAVCCSVLWWQAAFVAHDAGHSGITHDSWTDMVMGISLANFFGGLSLGWWKKNHNVHHIVTNDPEHDPDIQHLPFFAITPKLMQNLYSSYYKRVMEFDTVARVMVPIQHFTFYVLLSFGRFNLYVNSLSHLLSKERVAHRTLELVGIAVFWTWYLALLSSVDLNLMVMHILVSHMLTCILHVQITLSHFGMDTAVIENESFAELALRTTMDVDCPRWFDWFHGGLQFQVEHHLFPRIPRHNLRAVRPLVIAFAKENGLTFHNYKFLEGNGIVLRVLRAVAHEVKASLRVSGGKKCN
ncbi:hypothetical protein HDU83_001280 [Entophlyctis luteolus]|nr:hypothetical protein HDU82_006902 [Entophlyctis luteolus]KAJ3348528.1 hypothetical protein HDU83_001280 [Entophlyctis luteolus]KAJ3384534.1 hypothetical protein HDU84_002890 [Entophlyctis sp. JEL0112]